MPLPPTFVPFTTWHAVIEHVRLGKATYCQAPLDYRPVYVLARCGIDQLRDFIRVTPPSTDADPFWADAGHLDRFRYQL